MGRYHPHGDSSVYAALVRLAQPFSSNYPIIDGHGNFGSIDSDPPAAMRYTESRISSLGGYLVFGVNSEQASGDVEKSVGTSSNLPAPTALGGSKSDGRLAPVLLGKSTDFVLTFDSSEYEPSLLPTRLPLLLLNGASGIAVGMATNVPPFNLGELVDALKEIIMVERLPANANANAIDNVVTVERLIQLIPGPDFPTGGLIVPSGSDLEYGGVRDLYENGMGSIMMRGEAHIEEGDADAAKTRTKAAKAKTKTKTKTKTKGSRSKKIIITSLPYQVCKSSLLEKIASLVNSGDIVGISDLRDESDRDGIRIVVTVKNVASPRVVLNNLYKRTNLQTSFSGNFLSLVPSESYDTLKSQVPGGDLGQHPHVKPSRFSMKTALDTWLDFRLHCIRRMADRNLQHLRRRKEVVDGLIAVVIGGGLDLVIKTIRGSEGSAADTRSLLMGLELPGKLPGKGMPGKGSLSEAQAEAVLALKLSQLTKLNGDKLETELSDLKGSIASEERILSDDRVAYGVISSDLDHIKEKFNKKGRKTTIVGVTDRNRNGGEGKGEGGEDEGSDYPAELSSLDFDMNADPTALEMSLVENNNVVIVVTSEGNVKRMSVEEFKNQRRGTRGKTGTSNSNTSNDVTLGSEETDSNEKSIRHCFTSRNHDLVLFVNPKGVGWVLRGFQVPESGRTAKGAKLRDVLPTQFVERTEDSGSDIDVSCVVPIPATAISAPGTATAPATAPAIATATATATVTATGADGVASSSPYADDDMAPFLITTTKNGWIKKTKLSLYKFSRRGIVVTKVEDDDELNWVQVGRVDQNGGRGESIILGSKNGMATRFSCDEGLRFTSRVSRGVRSMRLRSGDEIAGMSVVADNDKNTMLVVTERGFGKRVKVSDFRTQNRGGIGSIAIKFKKSENGDKLACMTLVDEDSEVMMITSNGVIVRQTAKNIPVQSKTATGVRVQKLDENDRIVRVTVVPPSL